MPTKEQIIPKGYKHTEVGVIPSDWEVKKIGDLADVVGGGTPGTQILEYWNGNINWFTPTEIGDRKYAYFSKRKITSIGLQNSSAKTLNKGTILMTSRASIGDLAILKEKGTTNQGFQSLCPRDEVFSEFLYYLMLTKKSTLLEKASGSTFLEISPSSVRKIFVQKPSILEQTAIATALSDTDALIEKLTNLIEKKKNIKQGMMQELLTGKRRLPGFSGEWTRKKLGDLGEITGSGVDKKIRPDELPARLLNFLDVFHRNFIYSKNLSHEVTARLDQLIKCSAKKGDIFFTPSSEMPFDIGLSAITMEDMPSVVHSYHVNRFRLSEDWDLLFKAYIFQTKDFSNQTATHCEGSGKRYVLSLKTFREKLTVYYPEDKQEQSAISQILFDIDAEIEKLESQLSKYQNLKQGMMQTLLTGKIRLI